MFAMAEHIPYHQPRCTRTSFAHELQSYALAVAHETARTGDSARGN